MLNCDIVVASEKARFGLVEAKSGLVAVNGGGKTTLTPRIFPEF